MSSVYDRIADELGIGDPLGGDTPADRAFREASRSWSVTKHDLSQVWRTEKEKEKNDGSRAE